MHMRFIRTLPAWTAVFVAALQILFPREICAQVNAPPWQNAAERKPRMTGDETRAFMKRLASFVFDNHLKKAQDSQQRGMIYEYFWVAKKGTNQQWIQGEALDTMHDGAWFAVAMVNASRATGDPFYREILVKWQLPFYLRMFNHSDELFTSDRNDGRPGDDRGWLGSKEWLLQGRENSCSANPRMQESGNSWRKFLRRHATCRNAARGTAHRAYQW